MTETTEAPEAPKTISMETYIVVGLGENNVPALYTGLEVQGMERKRVADLPECKRIVDMISDELMYRAVASNVMQAMSQSAPAPPGQRVAEAMAEREAG